MDKQTQMASDGPDYVEHDIRLAAQPLSTREMRLVSPEHLEQFKTERDELAARVKKLEWALDQLFAWALQTELLTEHDDELVNLVKQSLEEDTNA